MANTWKVAPSRVAGAARNLGHAKIVISVAATAYASATGGLPVDFFVPFNDIGVNPYDVIEITGHTVTGYMCVFVKGTLTTADSPWTVRLWTGHGATPAEIGDGNITQTLHANVWFYPGAK